MMFTATLTKEAKKKCLEFLNDPFIILVDDDSKLTLHGLKQFYFETKEKDKLENMKKFKNIFKQIIVFCKNSQNALYIEHSLENAKAILSFMN